MTSRRPVIAVLDYGIGNLRSAEKALQHVGGDALLSSDRGFIRDADAVVLPGVGAFGACMSALRAAGLETSVHEAVSSGRPFLGICVGMQMLFDGSEETANATGLGVLPGTVEPGAIIAAHGDELVVACGDGTALQLSEVQPEGKRRMNARDFLNGTRAQVGEVLS